MATHVFKIEKDGDITPDKDKYPMYTLNLKEDYESLKIGKKVRVSDEKPDKYDIKLNLVRDQDDWYVVRDKDENVVIQFCESQFEEYFPKGTKKLYIKNL